MGSKPPVSRPPVKRRDPLSAEVSGVPDADAYLQEQLEARARRKAETERRKAETERQARREGRPKATYDMPLSIQEALKNVAEEESICSSDLVALAILRLVLDYRAGQVDLKRYRRPARSLKFAYHLDLLDLAAEYEQFES
jgi:thiamine pyrophosphate-dependent acetolactate synthase large subunit-like protein